MDIISRYRQISVILHPSQVQDGVMSWALVTKNVVRGRQALHTVARGDLEEVGPQETVEDVLRTTARVLTEIADRL